LSNPDQKLPRLRYVETLPVEVDGRQMIAIKDPQRYATAMLTVDPAALLILSKCDGRTTLGDLSAEFERQAGGPLPEISVRRLLDVFEKHLFFDSPRFQSHRKQIDDAWLESPVRPSALFDYAEGENEQAARDELRGMIDGFFLAAGFERGRDIAPGASDAAVLIAPHIDYQRGGPVWAKAYGEFAKSFRGSTVIILGTNHQPHRQPVCMTRKSFATPFGLMQVDEEVLDDIAGALSLDPFEDEMPHRVEHSVELAAVMLAYLRPDLMIVPILVGSARNIIEGQEDEETDEALQSLAEACRDALEKGDGNIALIASADLAHVGPMFDDPFRITPEKADINRKRDMEMLAPLQNGDPEGFIRYVAEEKDVRKICGLTPIYVAGAACGLPFELLAHDQWVDASGLGLVSYAALIARRQGEAENIVKH
jgi:MEMO1 family protein